MKPTSKLLLPVAALALSGVLATAQEQNQQQRPPGDRDRREGDRGRGDRGGFNMEEFRKRMEERLKSSLKVNDEEWAVLQPLIEKVQTKQREAMGSRFGGFFGGPGGLSGPGGPGGFRGRGEGGGAPGGSPGGTPGGGGDRGGDRGGPGGGDRGGSPEGQALRTALENESASADEIKAKLAAVRDSRKKASAELEAARAELQKVVTVRQEAVLVAMGMLE
jgi:hypothetical protein